MYKVRKQHPGNGVLFITKKKSAFLEKERSKENTSPCSYVEEANLERPHCVILVSNVLGVITMETERSSATVRY